MRILVFLCIAASVAQADGGHGKSSTLEVFNIGDAIGVKDARVPKFDVFQSKVEVGTLNAGSEHSGSGGEPVPVISPAKSGDGTRLVDDGTGKPKDGKASIDETANNQPLAKVEPNTRPFSALQKNGKPGLSVATFDDAGFVTTVTMEDGKKLDFTGKGITNQNIDDFLKNDKKESLPGTGDLIRRAVDASGASVTCKG